MKLPHPDPERKIIILTCYDYPTARALDGSDIDIVFVGDSVGTNILGYRSELEVTMEDMVHHFKAVRKGITSKDVMVDMPYRSYENVEMALKNAEVFRSRGADIIKLEGGKEISEIVSALRNEGITVMGHIGFQPQLAETGRRSVVGALSEEAISLYHDAIALQEAGAFALVLECVPEMVAREITECLSIPTIGIGSGKYTDGQVLVYTDIVGWYNLPYRFIVRYDSFCERTAHAANSFVRDVNNGIYPKRNHGFRIRKDELTGFREAIGGSEGT